MNLIKLDASAQIFFHKDLITQNALENLDLYGMSVISFFSPRMLKTSEYSGCRWSVCLADPL